MTDETTEETIIDENADDITSDGSSNDTSEENLKEMLKKRLELELGLPLTPQSRKKVEKDFNDDVILVENFPIVSVETLKIDNEILDEKDYILNESEGCIYLTSDKSGFLYLEYTWGVPEAEYNPLLDLMIEYEADTGWNKNASSIKENNVTVNYDTSLGKGARIQSMIADLRNKYACVVEMI